MRYLGLDYGTKTLGIALSDKTLTIATSFTTLRYEKENELYPQLKKIIEDYDIKLIVLGLPKNMNNSLGEKANNVLRFGSELENKLNIKVDYQDERLSTVSATNYLLEADMSRSKRKKVIDQLSASIILQSYLDKKEK